MMKKIAGARKNLLNPKVLKFHLKAFLGSLCKKFSKKIDFTPKSLVLNKIWLRILGFLTESIEKSMNSHVLVDKNHQNRSKTIKNRKIHPGAFSEFFFVFFFKMSFFAHFPTFWQRSLKENSGFGQIGHAVHPRITAYP